MREDIKRGSKFFAFRFPITPFARKLAPVPITVTQTASISQLQAECFLFLEQRHGLFQPAAIFQGQRLVAVAPLLADLIAQLEAERFLFLEQRHRLFQPAPIFQYHRLVSVATLQAILVA